jgi:hypothetical protein
VHEFPDSPRWQYLHFSVLIVLLQMLENESRANAVHEGDEAGMSEGLTICNSNINLWDVEEVGTNVGHCQLFLAERHCCKCAEYEDQVEMQSK